MPTAARWRRLKARQEAARLFGQLRGTTGSERVQVLEAIAAHTAGELLHSFCTDRQLEELYSMGLTNPNQGELFPEP